MGPDLWITLGTWSVVGLAGCGLAALLRERLVEVGRHLLNVVHEPVQGVFQRTQAWFAGVLAWLRAELRKESATEDGSPVYYIIGAFFYTGIAVISVAGDLNLINKTFEALGLEPDQRLVIPFLAAIPPSFIVVGNALWLGSVIADLAGLSHLAPWRRALGKLGRRLVGGLATAMLLLALGLVVVMGVERAGGLSPAVPTQPAMDQITSPLVAGVFGAQLGGEGPVLQGAEEPGVDEPSHQRRVFIQAGISALSLVCTAGSAMGLALLAKFWLLLAAFLGALTLRPVTLAAWLVTTVLTGVFNFLIQVINLAAAVGDLFVAPLRRWRVLSPTGQNNGTPPDDPDPVDLAQVNLPGPAGHIYPNQTQPGPAQPAAPPAAASPAPGPEAEVPAGADLQPNHDHGFNPFRRRRP